MIDKQTIVVVPTRPDCKWKKDKWGRDIPEYIYGKYRYTLEEAMQYVSENKTSWMLPYIFLYNKPLRDILREIGVADFLEKIMLLRHYDKEFRKYIIELQEKWCDLEVADFDISIVAINEDVRIMGHTFHGLDDIQKAVEKSKLDRYSISTYDDVVSFPHVGRVFESYPCFDSYDSMNETRSYQNYIFRRENITDDDIEATHDLTRLDNYRRVHENTPKEMLPMVYYKGDGGYMLVATLKELTNNQKYHNLKEVYVSVMRKFQDSKMQMEVCNHEGLLHLLGDMKHYFPEVDNYENERLWLGYEWKRHIDGLKKLGINAMDSEYEYKPVVPVNRVNEPTPCVYGPPEWYDDRGKLDKYHPDGKRGENKISKK